MRCENDYGSDTGFVASRDSVTTLGVQTSVVTTPSSQSVTLTTFPGSYFTIDYPSGWRVESAERPVSYGVDTTVRDSASPAKTFLRVDYTLQAHVASALEGASGQRANGRSMAGYREIGFGRTTLAGFDAVRWEFEALESGTLIHKVDIFLLDARGTGIAILTQAPAQSYKRWKPVFDQMYGSFALR
jgi:hypothetical protein